MPSLSPPPRVRSTRASVNDVSGHSVKDVIGLNSLIGKGGDFDFPSSILTNKSMSAPVFSIVPGLKSRSKLPVPSNGEPPPSLPCAPHFAAVPAFHPHEQINAGPRVVEFHASRSRSNFPILGKPPPHNCTALSFPSSRTDQYRPPCRRVLSFVRRVYPDALDRGVPISQRLEFLPQWFRSGSPRFLRPGVLDRGGFWSAMLSIGPDAVNRGTHDPVRLSSVILFRKETFAARCGINGGWQGRGSKPRQKESARSGHFAAAGGCACPEVALWRAEGKASPQHSRTGVFTPMPLIGALQSTAS